MTSDIEPCCTDVLSALWAKDPEDLLLGRPYSPTPHLLDTAAMAETIFDYWLRPGLREMLVSAVAPGDPDLARRRIALVAGLHDLGKTGQVFQFQQGFEKDQGWAPLHRSHLAVHGLAESGSGPRRGEGGKPRPVHRHEHVGGTYLAKAVFKDDDPVLDKWMAYVVGGHHGYWMETGAESHGREMQHALGGSGPQRKNWRTVMRRQQRLIESTVDHRVSETPPLSGPDRQAAFVLVCGVVMLADWLASEDSFVARGKERIASGHDPVADPLGWLGWRRDQAHEHLLSTVGTPSTAAVSDPFAALSFEPRPIQRAAAELADARGLWFVEQPTAEGKTDACIIRHLGIPGESLIFALPTRATTDAMAQRLRHALHPLGQRVHKSHQYASMNQTQGLSVDEAALYLDAPWHNKSLRRLLSPVSVATCDQVLASVLRQRNTPLRLLALANSHLVLDEVHTFDPYQRSLLGEVLSWMGRTDSRVTLMSATLPHTQREFYRSSYTASTPGTPDTSGEIEAHRPVYPSHHLHSPEGERLVLAEQTPVAVRPAPIDVDYTPVLDPPRARLAWVRESLHGYPTASMALFVNTIDAAIDAAEALRRAVFSHDVMALHSRMTSSQRSEVQDVLERRLGPRRPAADRPLIVVSTQVAEASLDLDFDLMCTDLAPVASLIQRAGRLHRLTNDQAVLERSHRLGSGGDRPSRVLTVLSRTADGTMDTLPTPLAAIPYLDLDVHAAHDVLRSVSQIDVDDIQDLLDFAAEASVRALTGSAFMTGDESEARMQAAMREQGDTFAQQGAARQVRVELGRFLEDPAPDYRHLVNMTGTVDDDLCMGTRYQRYPTSTFLLFDSRDPVRRSRHAVPGALPARAHEMPMAGVVSWQGALIPMSGKARETALELHAQTLARAGISAQQWSKARAHVVRSQLPLDLALLPEPASTSPDLTAAGSGDFDDYDEPAQARTRFDDDLGWIR